MTCQPESLYLLPKKRSNNDIGVGWMQHPLWRCIILTAILIILIGYWEPPVIHIKGLLWISSFSTLFSRVHIFRNWMSKDKDDGIVQGLGTWIKPTITKASLLWKEFEMSEHVIKLKRTFTATKNHFSHLDTLRKQVPYNETILTIAGTVLGLYALKAGRRRFRTATEIPPNYYKNSKRLKGFVATVSDSDNVRFYHQSLLSLGRPNLKKTDWKNETINVRLAGIDAPEMGHFGGLPQPYSREAKEWLTNYVHNRDVTIEVHRLDQYARTVATVTFRHFLFFKRNVSLAMVQAGFATVYDSAGAEYGGIKAELVAAEKKAKSKRLGMWKQSAANYVSPAEYKKQLAKGN